MCTARNFRCTTAARRVAGLSSVLLFYLHTHVLALDLTAPPETALGPAAFEEWVANASERMRHGETEPTAISDPILKRLKDGIYVTDKAVMRGIGAWTSYEGLRMPREPEKRKNSFLKTVDTIDKVNHLLYGRQLLQIRLQMRKAELLHLEDNRTEAVSVRTAAKADLEVIHGEVLTLHVENLTILGEILQFITKKKEAETAFLNALSFPWYLVKSPARQQMGDWYIRAGRDLIGCRRGDLSALQQTFFIPAALNELGPSLNEALIEAGGKPLDLGFDGASDRVEEPFEEEFEKANGKP